jgi:hypothetical protein
LFGLKRRRSHPLTWLSSLTRPEGRIAAGARSGLRPAIGGPIHVATAKYTPRSGCREQEPAYQ